MTENSPTSLRDPQGELEALGRVWLRNFFDSRNVAELAELCDVGTSPGARLCLSPELSRHIGAASRLARHMADFGVDPAPVRLVAFNKSEAANWSVPWHQDRVIAIHQKHGTNGYKNWVAKDEFWHCEPPVELLNEMIFVRVHLDACDESNGTLELALGTHKHGFIPSLRVKDFAAESDIEICCAKPGDVLIAKALILHRSRSAEIVSQRRALRIDYARRHMLSDNLSWAIPA